MAGKARNYEAVYKGRKVRTDSIEDMTYLYTDERLSTTDIAALFDGRISNKTVARRLAKYGIPRRYGVGEDNPMWTGGKKVGKGGYMLIWKPDHPFANTQGYVSEHRLVVEQHIGRLLSPTEVVHHINKDKMDNRIENLQLMESNSAHAKLESQLRRRDQLGRFVS